MRNSRDWIRLPENTKGTITELKYSNEDMVMPDNYHRCIYFVGVHSQSIHGKRESSIYNYTSNDRNCQN